VIYAYLDRLAGSARKAKPRPAGHAPAPAE
jgi:hypothetical protein